MEGQAAVNPIGHCLSIIGFNTAQSRQRIMEDAFTTFEDFRLLNERDISKLAEAFGKCTQADGRIIFGLSRTKKLKGLMHWIQDHF